MDGMNSSYIARNQDAFRQKSLFGFFVLIALIPFFKTTGFDAISPALGTLCNGMLLLEATGFFLAALITFGVSPFSWAVLAFELWDYVIAVFLSGNQMPSLFYLVGTLGIVLLFDLGFRYDFGLMLDAVSFIFTVFVLCMFIFILLYRVVV